eukprot:493394-Amorphochlora_amoeboformis.AAC.2
MASSHAPSQTSKPTTGINKAISDIATVGTTVSSFFSGIRNRVNAQSGDVQARLRKLSIRYVTPRILVLSKGLPKRSTVSASILFPVAVKFDKPSYLSRYMTEVAGVLRGQHGGRCMVQD